MPTDKQLIRDKEYYGDYQGKSRYTVEQWEKILTNDSFVNPTELAILKEIFASANHAASLSQLSFHHKKDPSYFIDKINQLAEHLGKPNGISSDVDLNGNEYWWFLLFWGKETKLSGLEWKLIPELAEAMEYTYPELENQYISYMSEIEHCEQIRYSKEDSVWIASSLLLYEKYYTEHPTDIYDLLLMQYEVQQRAQKIHGQDVDVDVITDSCNADSDRCLYPYLRDIDKYWRVTYPGEIEDAMLRPEKIDYNAYVPSRFGYLKLSDLCTFLETDYCKIADPNYIEVDESNPFYKMVSFLKEHGQGKYMDLSSPTEEDIEQFLKIKEKGQEALAAFHSIGEILTEQYPSFVQTEKAGWLERDNITIKNTWLDSFVTSEYEQAGPALSILCGQWEEANNKILFSVVLSFPIESPELTEEILEKCNNLAVLTSANFQVEKAIRLDTIFSTAFGNSILAYANFEEQSVLDGSLSDVMLQFETAIQILASYYLDICETIYKPRITVEEEEAAPDVLSQEENAPAFGKTSVPSGTGSISMPGFLPVKKRKTKIDNHPDRKKTEPSCYPKNILFQGPKGCGKRKAAIQCTVGIIENKKPEEIRKESYTDVLTRYQKYKEEGRILYSGTSSLDYEQWMEGPEGEGRFSFFANHISGGNYVCLMEELNQTYLLSVMGDAYYLLDERKREGQPEFETVDLLPSLRPFSLPSNLYLIGTTEEPITFLTGLDYFHIHHIEVKEDSLTNIVIKGIPVIGLVSAMNQRLSFLLGPDYQLGQEFFLPLKENKSIEMLGRIMYEQILPLVLGWMKEAGQQGIFPKNPYEGARMIFGDYQKSSPDYEMILAKTVSEEEIFGQELGMKGKIIYQIQKDAFFQIQSYLELS